MLICKSNGFSIFRLHDISIANKRVDVVVVNMALLL